MATIISERGNNEVIAKIYLFPSISNRYPLKNAVIKAPHDLIPKNNETFLLASAYAYSSVKFKDFAFFYEISTIKASPITFEKATVKLINNITIIP